jgi:hypothetical protein
VPEAIIVIGRAQIGTCQNTVVGFLRQAGCAIRRVNVRLSEAASGVAIEEKGWFNDSTDAAALAEEVADHIARSASGRPDLEAIVSVSDEG